MSKIFKKKSFDRKYTKDLYEKYKPYFEVHSVYFQGGSCSVFLGSMRYTMCAPALEHEGVMMVPAVELARIYSPWMKVEEDANTLRFTYQHQGTMKQVTVAAGSLELSGCNATLSLERAPEKIDGLWYVDIENLMRNAFDKFTVWDYTYLAPGEFLGIGNTEEELFQNPNVIKDMIIAADKKSGILRRAYYFEAGNCMQPYTLYIPSTYSPDKPSHLVMVLHGASDGVANDRDLKWKPLAFEQASEGHNLITLFVEGYGQGFYGGAYPDLHPEQHDITPEEQFYLNLCETEPFCALEQVLSQYKIDERNIFITGNSMGGCGTFWLSRKYPRFRAIAPCGALTTDDITTFNLTSLQNVPAMFVCGTENIGFDHLKDVVIPQLNEADVPAILRVVPGGTHPDAWAYALDDIYDFFESHSVQ